MNRIAILASSAVVTIAAGTVVAATASATTTTKTLNLIGTSLNTAKLSTPASAESDVLRLPSSQTTLGGKTPVPGAKQGYSAESCALGTKVKVCRVGLALKGGLIYGNYAFPVTNGQPGLKGHGKIVGGEGAYNGVTGTIAVALSQPAPGSTTSKQRWTVKYTK